MAMICAPRVAKEHAVKHGVDIEYHAAYGPLPGQEPEFYRESEDEQERAGSNEEPVRGVKQHKAQAAPAVVKCPKVRRAAALVRPERDGYLGDVCAHL